MPLPGLSSLIGRLLPNKVVQQTLGRKKVRQTLVEALQPQLTAHGFTPFKGNLAVRCADRWIDVVEISFSSTVSSRADSPSLDVGRYFTFVPRDGLAGEVKEVDGSLWPTGALCHLRKALFRFKRPKDKIWIIRNEQDMAECCVEMERLLGEYALPWFDWLNDFGVVLALLQTGEPDLEGKSRDPLLRGTWNFGNYFGRHVVAGLVAFELGQWALCVELLQPVLQHGGTLGRNEAVLPLPSETLERIGRVADLAAGKLV